MGRIGLAILRRSDSHVDQQDISYAVCHPDFSFDQLDVI